MRSSATVFTGSLLLAALSIALSFDAEQSSDIDNSKYPPGPNNTGIDAVFLSNDDSLDLNVCWVPENNFVYDGPTICVRVTKGNPSQLATVVGHKFTVEKYSEAETEEEDKTIKQKAILEIVGGKHFYDVDEVYQDFLSEQSTGANYRAQLPAVYVRTPDDCPDDTWESFGSLWRDAIRRAAHRRGVALCMCGALNTTSTFTVTEPNREVPVILNSLDPDGICNCASPPAGHAIDYYYDMWLSCSCGMREDSIDLYESEHCPNPYLGEQDDEWAVRWVTNSEKQFQNFQETRLSFLHTTVMVDRLSMKGKMWGSLNAVFGFERAGIVMPTSFYTIYPEQKEHLMEICRKAVEESENNGGGAKEEGYYIVKNEDLHRQLGISIASTKSILTSEGISHGFTFATVFLPRPFLVNGYKINMRRYMVAVCVGGRLRAYVHDDGKNIYTKAPYREPWESSMMETVKSKLGVQDELSMLRGRLDELITTGYVPASHYDDKPLSGLEFFAYVRERGLDPSQFQHSMWTRLALALHASMHDGDYNLCEMRQEMLGGAAQVPPCMEDSIRFQHFGCDFHVDADLTGYESRVFECNKGPDMHAHNFRDGTMKRDVAADIMSFMGFSGPFEGSAEAARRFRMNLIYDSETFDVEDSFAFLESLKDMAQEVKIDRSPTAKMEGMSSVEGNVAAVSKSESESESGRSEEL